MKGRDIKCPTCGGRCINVAEDFEIISPKAVIPPETWLLEVFCTNGHKFAFGVRDPEKGIESMLRKKP